MALVPLIIRWGAEASSDRLRQRARCTKCGHKGATLQHPGWAGTHIGFQPFPIEPSAGLALIGPIKNGPARIDANALKMPVNRELLALPVDIDITT